MGPRAGPSREGLSVGGEVQSWSKSIVYLFTKRLKTQNCNENEGQSLNRAHNKETPWAKMVWGTALFLHVAALGLIPSIL